MKTILIIASLLLLTGLAYFFYLGYKSQSGSARGLVDLKLSPCPESPNCICTEYIDDQSHYVEAIKFSRHNPELILASITQSIKDTGGVITNTETNYIAARYTSNIFHYVDDFEVRIDAENQLIHMRSASRVGRSDLGANLKRIELFKAKLATLMH